MELYEKIMAVLAMFTALCIAGGWLIKIFKAVKKPSDDVMEMLDRDNKRLRTLEEDSKYFHNAVKLLIQSNFAILGHLRTANNTGEMAKIEEDIKTFLINN